MAPVAHWFTEPVAAAPRENLEPRVVDHALERGAEAPLPDARSDDVLAQNLREVAAKLPSGHFEGCVLLF